MTEIGELLNQALETTGSPRGKRKPRATPDRRSELLEASLLPNTAST